MAVYEDSGFATEDVDRSIVEGEIETSEQNNKNKQIPMTAPVAIAEDAPGHNTMQFFPAGGI